MKCYTFNGQIGFDGIEFLIEAGIALTETGLYGVQLNLGFTGYGRDGNSFFQLSKRYSPEIDGNHRIHDAVIETITPRPKETRRPWHDDYFGALQTRRTPSPFDVLSKPTEDSRDLLVRINGFGGQDRGTSKPGWKKVRGKPVIKKFHVNMSRERPRNDGIVILHEGDAILISSIGHGCRVPERWVLENKAGRLEPAPWRDWLEIELGKSELADAVKTAPGLHAFTTDHENGKIPRGIEVVESINGTEVLFGNLLETEEDDRPWISYVGNKEKPAKVAVVMVGEVPILVDAVQPVLNDAIVRIIPTFANGHYRQQYGTKGEPKCLAYGYVRMPENNGIASDVLWLMKPDDVVEVNGARSYPRTGDKLFAITNSGTQIKGV